MKLSYNLLKKLVPIKLSPEKLSELLTDKTFEIESFESMSAKFSGVIVGKVVDIQKHPNADKLQLISVDVGNKIISPIVCGAHNFTTGDKVALALPGAKLPASMHGNEPFTLSKAKIRGVESQGMICAKYELGLSEKPDEGIWILDPTQKLGANVADICVNDTQIDVSLPANRPDLFSHLGVAREISAVTNARFVEPSVPTIKPKSGNYKFSTDFKISTQFIAIHIKNIRIEQSPQYIQDFLKVLGIKPINNIVDITNFVMVKLGQPSHAFDADKVNSGIDIRLAKSKETIEGINHKKYKLEPWMPVLSDSKGALDIAGIMGGSNTEVSDTTKSVILTVNTFNPVLIRKTTSALNLRTDASAIFEKGLHENLGLLATEELLDLIKQILPDSTIEQVSLENKSRRENTKINFTRDSIESLIGAKVSKSQIFNGLKAFGIKMTGTDKLVAQAPWWRPDIMHPADLSDEILKSIGLNSVEPKPLILQPSDQSDQLAEFIYNSKLSWMKLGSHEVQNYSFISDTDREVLDKPNLVKIANPLSSEQSYLKQSLLLPILKLVSRNAKQSEVIDIFEIGKIYFKLGSEQWQFGSVYWDKSQTLEYNLQILKGKIVDYFKSLDLNIHFEQTDKKRLRFTVGKQQVGYLEIINSHLIKQYGLEEPVSYAEIDFEAVFRLKKTAKHREASEYPESKRDISIIIDQTVKWSDVQKCFSGYEIIKEVNLIDGPHLRQSEKSHEFHKKLAGKGKKNYSIRACFQSVERTLTDHEMTGILEQIMLKLKNEIGAEIR